jgi:hypothetical protein
MNSLPPPISANMLAMPALPTAQPAYQQPLILQQAPSQNHTDASRFQKSAGQKFRVAVYASILFMILSTSAAFRILNQLNVLITNSNNSILDEYNCGSVKSTIFMGILFFLVTFFFILT